MLASTTGNENAIVGLVLKIQAQKSAIQNANQCVYSVALIKAVSILLSRLTNTAEEEGVTYFKPQTSKI